LAHTQTTIFTNILLVQLDRPTVVSRETKETSEERISDKAEKKENFFGTNLKQ
jgi:hypothetical protein